MLSQQEINALFNQGKQDVLTFMRAAFAHEAALLASLPDGDPQLLRVMSLASGRLTQIKEFHASLSRIEHANGGGSSDFGRKLEQARYVLDAIERPSITIREGDDNILFLDDIGAPKTPDTSHTVPLGCLLFACLL